MKQSKLSQIDYATFAKAITGEWGGISTPTLKRKIFMHNDTIQDLLMNEMEDLFVRELEGTIPPTFIPAEGPLNKITSMGFVPSTNRSSLGAIYGFTDDGKKYELVQYVFDITPVDDSYMEFGFVIKTRVRERYDEDREFVNKYEGPTFGPFDLDYMFRLNKHFLSKPLVYVNSSFDDEENEYFERVVHWSAICGVHAFISPSIDYDYYLNEMSKIIFDTDVDLYDKHVEITSTLINNDDDDDKQLAIEHKETLLLEYTKDPQAM